MVAGTSRIIILLAVTLVWKAVNVLLRLHLLQLTSVFFCLHRHNFSGKITLAPFTYVAYSVIVFLYLE
jgi:hypothetical protein